MSLKFFLFSFPFGNNVASNFLAKFIGFPLNGIHHESKITIECCSSMGYCRLEGVAKAEVCINTVT